MQLFIKYFDDEIAKIEKFAKGDWIDLRAAEDVEMKAGEYEAHIAPRSSTFKNFGIILTNSVGVVDNSYCGDADEWKAPVYALRDTHIKKDERICQFRIMERQPELEFVTVDKLRDDSRGGFGSTGTK